MLTRSIRTNSQFENEYQHKIGQILLTEPLNRGSAHAMKDDTTAMTHELMHVTEVFEVGQHAGAWAEVVKPNLPWANDHFAERISGEPLNPSPSEAWWPYARKANEEHKIHDKKFSHTYPERFWPRFSKGRVDNEDITFVRRGIRFQYGDLNSLIEVLKNNPRSRQAYLPIWFPEDLSAAVEGLRVPCSMGYHFIYNPAHEGLDCVYTMRSCDLVRFYRDDVYMAGLLLQHVALKTDQAPAKLIINIANLHCFPGDQPFLESLLPKQAMDRRHSYDFGAM